MKTEQIEPIDKDPALAPLRISYRFSEDLTLTGPTEKNDLDIGCAIRRGNSWIHKNCLRGGGQLIIFEGCTAVEWLQRQPGYQKAALDKTWQTVVLVGSTFPDCITVIRRGDFLKLKVKQARFPSGATINGVAIPAIPEIHLVPTKQRQPDIVYTINLR